MGQKEYLKLSEDGKTVLSCDKGYKGAVVIPNSVTTIEGEAFSGCTGLTSVVIPSNMTATHGHAFYGCTSLTTIEIPKSVTRIGEMALSYCLSLT